MSRHFVPFWVLEIQPNAQTLALPIYAIKNLKIESRFFVFSFFFVRSFYICGQLHSIEFFACFSFIHMCNLQLIQNENQTENASTAILLQARFKFLASFHFMFTKILFVHVREYVNVCKCASYVIVGEFVGNNAISKSIFCIR